MGKKEYKQLISTAFDDLNQDLNEKEAYFLSKIVTNEYVSKTGIYRLFAEMLAGTLGFSKILSQEEILKVAGQYEYLIAQEGNQKYQRAVTSQMMRISSDRLKDVFDVLVRKGKIKYDYEKNLMYVINFHKYVPFGSAKPSIIFGSIIGGMEKNQNHPFYKDYLVENKEAIKKLIEIAEATANASRKPEITLKDLNFVALKSLIFK